MRPMTRLVLGVVVLVGILAAVAVGLPSHVTVTRSVVINAPELAIFPYLNNLHEFRDWSPWSVRDPQLAVTYGGPQTGKGAQIKWTSRVPSIGTGSMEISETEPNRHIDLAVNFNGLDGTSSYDVVPAGSGSKVTWTFGYEFGLEPAQALESVDARWLRRVRVSRGPRPAQGEGRSGTAPDDANHWPDPGRWHVLSAPAARRSPSARCGAATRLTAPDKARPCRRVRPHRPPERRRPRQRRHKRLRLKARSRTRLRPRRTARPLQPPRPRRRSGGGSSNSRKAFRAYARVSAQPPEDRPLSLG